MPVRGDEGWQGVFWLGAPDSPGCPIIEHMWYFMEDTPATVSPHHALRNTPPVGPRLLIRQASPLISQLPSISRGRSTIRHLWTRWVEDGRY